MSVQLFRETITSTKLSYM